MKAKTKFMNVFKLITEKGRIELVSGFTTNPRSLNILALEIKNDTKLGKELLEELGFEDD